MSETDGNVAVKEVQPPPYAIDIETKDGEERKHPPSQPVGAMVAEVENLERGDVAFRRNKNHKKTRTDTPAEGGNEGEQVDAIEERNHARILLLFRILQWILALISFALIASVSGYSNVKSFQYLLAMGIIVFVLNIPLIGLEWFMIGISYGDEEKEVTRVNLSRVLPKINVVYDALMAFLCFGAACAAAGVTSDPPDGLSSCNTKCSIPKASVAMMFLLSFALLASFFICLGKLRKQLQEDALASPPSAQGKGETSTYWQHNFFVGIVLRMFQWILALVSFACFLSLDNNSDFSAIQFAIAIGIIVFIIAFILSGFEIYGRMQQLEFLPLGLGSWLGSLVLAGYDVIIALLAFGSACAAAGITSLSCSVLPFDCNVGRAGVGTLFAAWFFMWGSIYMSFKDHGKAITLRDVA